MIDRNLQTAYKHAAQMIRNARYVVVFTGAGISTPSGIPDFRSAKDGLWQRYDPMQVASLTAFQNNPELFFDWFRPLFMLSCKAKPNPAHNTLAELENFGVIKSIITQNIDGLHQKSGSRRVIELHGTALMFTCPLCGNHVTAESVYIDFSSGSQIPTCVKCGGILKPEVTLFEEPLPMQAWQEAETDAMNADLMLVIGSSLEVYPASTIPLTAFRNGSKLIINNMSSTPMDGKADILIPMDAAEFLPTLLKSLGLVK